MSSLLGLISASTTTIVSYFGSMDILDDQAAFDDTFGSKPIHLSSSPTELESNEIRDKIHAYAEKCIFDVFLEVCRADYVGESFTDSEEKTIRGFRTKI